MVQLWHFSHVTRLCCLREILASPKAFGCPALHFVQEVPRTVFITESWWGSEGKWAGQWYINLAPFQGSVFFVVSLSCLLEDKSY